MNYTNTTADTLLNKIVMMDHHQLFEAINRGDLDNELTTAEPYCVLPPQEKQESISLETIPNDVLTHIFSFNDPIDHCRIRRACREWRDLPLDGYKVSNANCPGHRRIIYQMGNSVMTINDIELILVLKTGNVLNGRQIRAMNGIMRSSLNYKMGIAQGYHKYWYVNDRKKYITEVNHYGINDDRFKVEYSSNECLMRFAYFSRPFHKILKWHPNGYIKEISIIKAYHDDDRIKEGAQILVSLNGDIEAVLI